MPTPEPLGVIQETIKFSGSDYRITLLLFDCCTHNLSPSTAIPRGGRYGAAGRSLQSSRGPEPRCGRWSRRPCSSDPPHLKATSRYLVRMEWQGCSKIAGHGPLDRAAPSIV